MVAALPSETYFTLVSVRLIVVALGLLIAFMAFKSYRKNHSNAMLLLSVGFVLVTIGAVIEGVLFEFLSIDLFQATIVESLIVALGFIIIIFSIFGSKT